MVKYDDASIETMTVMQHIRSKSSMYVGAADLDADVQLFKEILDNSVDESIDPNKEYKVKIIIFYKGNRYQIAILDEGRGIPCGVLKHTFTVAYTSGKYSSAAYNGLSTGTFGIGSKATVALSKNFLAVTKRPDGLGRVVISKGEVKDYVVNKPLPGSNTGTLVVYETDRSILTQSGLFMEDPNGLQRALELVEYLSAFKNNTKFEVYTQNTLLADKWFKQPPEQQWAELSDATGTFIYKTPDDITPMSYVRTKYEISGKTVWDLIIEKDIDRSSDTDVLGFDINLGISEDLTPGIVASVNGNMMNDLASSHIVCVSNVLKAKLVDYFDTENSELVGYFKTKYNLPLFGYIRVLYKNASFVGQTKKAFKDVAFDAIYTEKINKIVSLFSSEKWETLFNIMAKDLEEKFLASSNKSLRVGRSLKNAAADMINRGSYIPCDIKNNEIAELLITEGDNTGGYVKAVRDPSYQAVFKLTGKPINAITADKSALRANAVYQDMLRLFGVGPSDTTLDKFNFNKIGLLADADPDGYHIQALLVGNIYKINPLILETGRVFIATPPLYVLETKDTNIFLRDQHALDDLRVDSYYTYFDIELARPDMKVIHKLSYSEFRDFVYLTNRIGTLITDISNKIVIDPMILEQMIHCVEYLSSGAPQCDKIKDILKLTACHYHKIANTLLLVEGATEISIPLDRLVYEINAYILPELERAHWRKYIALLSSKVTDKYKRMPVSFMLLYNYFQEMNSKFSIQRLKGLGECTPEQLKYTCVDPTTRTFSVIKSLGDVDRLYELLGVDTSARKALLQDDLNIGI